MPSGSTMLLSLLIRVREEGVGLLGKARSELQQLAAASHIADAAMFSGRALYGTALVAKGLGQALAEANHRGRELGETLIHGSLGAAAAIYAFKKSFLDIAVGEEQLHTRLQGIEGTKDRADTAMAWLEEFRSKTAFTMADVSQSWVDLRERAINPLNGSFRAIADAAAATGKPMAQVAREYGEIVEGHGEGRFRDLGIQITDSVKKLGMVTIAWQHFGKTVTETAAKNNHPAVEAILNRALLDKYEDAAKRASEGWSGTLLKMSENWQKFALAVMNKGGVFDLLKEKFRQFSDDGSRDEMDQQASAAQTLADVLKNLINTIFDGLTWLRANLPGLKREVESFIKYIGGWKVVLGGIALFLAGPFLMSLIPVGSGIIALAAAIGTVLLPALAYLAGAFVALGALMLTTPIGWILMGLLALGVVIGWLSTHWDTATKAMADAWAWFKGLFNVDFGMKELANEADNIKAAWDKLGDFFTGLGERIKNAIRDAIVFVREQVDAVQKWLPTWAGGTVSTVQPTAAGAAGGMVGGGAGALGAIAGTVKVDIAVKGDATGRVTSTTSTGPLNLDAGLIMVGP